MSQPMDGPTPDPADSLDPARQFPDPFHEMAPDANESAYSESATAELTPTTRRLPPWRVLLHDDEFNEMLYVVQTIMAIARLPLRNAAAKMLEAHKRGLTQLLTTHRERAELYVQQFARRNLMVTIEPAP